MVLSGMKNKRTFGFANLQDDHKVAHFNYD